MLPSWLVCIKLNKNRSSESRNATAIARCFVWTSVTLINSATRELLRSVPFVGSFVGWCVRRMRVVGKIKKKHGWKTEVAAVRSIERRDRRDYNSSTRICSRLMRNAAATLRIHYHGPDCGNYIRSVVSFSELHCGIDTLPTELMPSMTSSLSPTNSDRINDSINDSSNVHVSSRIYLLCWF